MSYTFSKIYIYNLRIIDIFISIKFFNNDTTAHYESSGNNSIDVPFKFLYSTTEQTFGYEDEQGQFQAFKSGGTDVSDTTAVADKVLSGYTFYLADGTKTTGSIVSRSASSETIVGNKTYSSGYYSNSWTVSGLDTSDADATADNIESGKTAYVNGVKITGTVNVPKSVQRYTETINQLSPQRYNFAVGSIGNNCIIVAGETSSTYYTNYVDKYDTNLTRSSLTTLPISYLVVWGWTSTKDYIFIGGADYTTSRYPMYAYDIDLTLHTAQDLWSLTKEGYRACHVGNYALFGGGPNLSGYGYQDTVETYDMSLVRSTATKLSMGRYRPAGASNENYAIFGGGVTGTSVRSNADCYDSSLTQTRNTLYNPVGYNAGADNSKMAIFAGGSTANSGTNTFYRTVTGFDTSLVKYMSSLSTGRTNMGSATIQDNVSLFVGGGGQTSSSDTHYYQSTPARTVDVCTASLVVSQATVLPSANEKPSCIGINVGNYGLFFHNSTTGKPIDAYYVS